MSKDKIRVSWDEVHSTNVDDQIKRQEALAHAQDHVRQQQNTGQPPPATPSNSSLLVNAVIYMALFGAAGGFLASIVGEMTGFPRQWDQHSIVDEGRVLATEIVWYSLVSTIMAVFLAVGEPIVSRNYRGATINASVGSIIGLIGGFIVSLFIDKLFRAIGGDPVNQRAQFIIARMVAWGIVGLFLAIGPGVVLMSFKRMAIGLAGGLMGGFLGGALFDPVGSLFEGSGVVSRIVVLTAIGLFVGLGTGIIENAAKTGWLRVTEGLIAGKQFILYRNPTVIGSSPQCEIYLFKDPRVRPRHAQIRIVPGGFEMEDMQSGTGTLVNGRPISKTRLRAGDQITIGTASFVFQEKTKTQA